MIDFFPFAQECFAIMKIILTDSRIMSSNTFIIQINAAVFN